MCNRVVGEMGNVGALLLVDLEPCFSCVHVHTDNSTLLTRSFIKNKVPVSIYALSEQVY